MAQQMTCVQEIRGNFWRFATPAVIAMLANGLYQVIDGVFVGRYVGFNGLAAINLAWPLLSFTTGFGVLIGMGGGSIISIHRGRRDMQAGQDALVTSIHLMFIWAIVLAIFLANFATSFFIFQQAAPISMQMGLDYVQIFIYGSFFVIAAAAIPMLVRNNDRPKLATWLALIGAISNIILDYFFLAILKQGLSGAAIATIISQIIVTAIGLSYFFSSRRKIKITKYNFNFKLAWHICKLGASSLFMFFYFGFILALHNKLFMQYGSAVYVGAFAIVGYIGTIYYLFAEGIANGLQPPVSYYYGAKQFKKIRYTLIYAMAVVMGAGVFTTFIINLYPDFFISFFLDNDTALLDATRTGIRIQLATLALDGFLFTAAVFYLALDQSRKSFLIAVSNMLVQLPFLFILPQFLEINGIWLTIPVSNILLVSIIIPIMYKDIKNYIQLEEEQ